MNNKTITKDEFIRKYTETTGITVADLEKAGRVPAPCDCDWVFCEGWQMAHTEPLAGNGASV